MLIIIYSYFEYRPYFPSIFVSIIMYLTFSCRANHSRLSIQIHADSKADTVRESGNLTCQMSKSRSFRKHFVFINFWFSPQNLYNSNSNSNFRRFSFSLSHVTRRSWLEKSEKQRKRKTKVFRTPASSLSPSPSPRVELFLSDFVFAMAERGSYGLGPRLGQIF